MNPLIITLRVVLCLLMSICSIHLVAQSSDKGMRKKHEIIPNPVSYQIIEGKPFVITPTTLISCSAEFLKQANYLQEQLAASTGWDLEVITKPKKKGVVMVLDTIQVKKNEGYNLNVSEKMIKIVAHDAAGAFYGVQTLLQLLPPEVYSPYRQKDVVWKVDPVFIEDAPARPWRGVMLDVARYFYDKEFVKKYIDMIAMYKLNKLQFHFIDDSGWRLEIKKYPRLTEIGAWAGTDTHRLGGFYTQEDIKEIVEYAGIRGIEVIPEIEFPAHMLSAIVAYPWLSCTELQHEVPVSHFISRDLLCVGKETSYQFLKDVLEETVQLFPSKYINIGGDEAVYKRWEECEKCQAVMKREGLTKASQLQGYLTNVVAKMMAEKGKTVVGWEEIFMRGEVSTPVVGVIWHNVADTLKAMQGGHKAILSPCTHMYYDFPENNTPGEVKAATWCPPISLEKTYSMPINDYSATSTTLGVQACFWSDQFIHGTLLQEIPNLNENRSERYAEYLSFPRVLALSEVAWKRESERNFEDFRRRLSFHYKRLDQKGCAYRIPEPHVEKVEKTSDGKVIYHLSPSVDGSEIRYTINGSYPNPHSSLYKSPVTVNDKNLFRAITVLGNQRYSLPIYEATDYSAYKEFGVHTASWRTLQLQIHPAPYTFECTGKINGNGKYEIYFVPTLGGESVKFGKLQVLKRKELVAEADNIVSPSNEKAVAAYKIEINEFEAGTPFYITVEANRTENVETAGHIFIKKCE